MNSPQRLTTKEACRYLSICRTTLYRLAQVHSLKRVRLGGAVRWPVTELDRLVRICTSTAFKRHRRKKRPG